MEQNEIIKLIPPVLAEKMQEKEVSIVGNSSGVRIIPTSSLLLIDEGGVSGFLARQIMEMKDMINKIGGEQDAESITEKK